MTGPLGHLRRYPPGLRGSNLLRFRFSIKLLFLAVTIAGVAAFGLAWVLKPVPVVTSGDGVDGGKFFRVRGPIVVQHSTKPAIAFTSLEHSKFGMGSQIPFLVVIRNELPDDFAIQSESFLHQAVSIVSRVSLKLTQGELYVDYCIWGQIYEDLPLWSDGTPAFDEIIQFYLPGMDSNYPLEYNLNDGRVFVIRLHSGKNTVEQLDEQLFTPTEIKNLDADSLASFVYEWWQNHGG